MADSYVKMKVGEKRPLYGNLTPASGTLTLAAMPTYVLYDADGDPVSGFSGNCDGYDTGAQAAPRCWINLDTATLTAGFYTLVFTVTDSAGEVYEPEVCLRVMAAQDAPDAFDAVRQGEKRRVYGQATAETGTLTITGTPTCTLYDSAGLAVSGMSGMAVTGYDAAAAAAPRVWYDLDTENPADLAADFHTLVFTFSATGSDGITRTYLPGVLVHVEEVPAPAAMSRLTQLLAFNAALDSGAYALEVVDVDGDGKQEVILIGATRIVHIYRMADSLMERVGSLSTTIPVVECVKVADIDGDGNQEIILSGHTPGGGAEPIEIWRWNGTTGTLLYSTTWADGQSWCLAVGQLVAGGSWQVVGGSWDTGTGVMRVRVYDAALSAYSEYTWTDAPAATNPEIWTQPAIIGDIDGDGQTELVVFGRNAAWHAEARVFRYTVGGGITYVKSVAHTVKSEWHGGIFADVDGDGVKEIVCGGWLDFAGTHKAWLRVYSLDFSTIKAEWTGAANTEIWYVRANDYGSRGIMDITIAGGSGVAGEVASFGGYRYAGGALTEIFNKTIANRADATGLVLETAQAADIDADGTQEVVLTGWWTTGGVLLEPVFFAYRDRPYTKPSWWKAGGAQGCIQALKARGAASYAASLLDLSGAGHNAAEGVTPSWDALTGWTFNGTTQYLDTGILASAANTVLILFTGFTTSPKPIFGAYSAANTYLGVFPDYGDGKAYYEAGGELGVAPGMAQGVLAIAGQQGYRFSKADGGAIPAGSGRPALNMYLGGINLTGTPYLAGVRIQAFAVYSGILTAAQVAAVAAAMAEL